MFKIIMPVYNAEEYLEKAVDSIINQTLSFKDNVVIHLIDDSSSDGSLELCNKYKEQYPDNFIVTHFEENQGVSAVRNYGIKMCKNEKNVIVGFVDSDDFLLPGAIDALLDTAFAHDCDLVEGGAYYVYDHGKAIMHRYKSDQKISSPYALHGQPWGKVYRGALFEHLCFPEGYWYEDSLLSYLIFPNVRQAWVTEHMAYGYRINQAGIVKSSHGKPKSVDTYWITEELMAEHAQAGLPADDAYFRYILLQIRLNQHRIADLPEEIQESVFVLTCDLFCTTFPTDLDVSGNRTLIKALRTRDFGMYKMCCKLF